MGCMELGGMVSFLPIDKNFPESGIRGRGRPRHTRIKVNGSGQRPLYTISGIPG
jgi:hypothetical protein